ncbi:MAG: coiled-coil domain-containing protein [bacterium]
MPIITVPKVLREKLGEDGVDSLIELLNQSEQKVKGEVITLSDEKFARKLSEEISGVKIEFSKKLSEEISGVKQEIALLEGKLEARISEVRAEFKVDLEREISKLDKRINEETSKLRVDIAQFKSELIKWMFLFWVGQLVCIAGLLKWIR